MSQIENLDRTDFELIRLLRKDARASNKWLAEQVGLAPSSCLVRVQSLIARGVIAGFHADLDPGKVGIGLQAMIAVTLVQHNKDNLEAFEHYLSTLAEVAQFFHVAGPTDFMVHVWARDASHLRELAVNAFTTRPEVMKIETELIFAHRSTWGLGR